MRRRITSTRWGLALSALVAAIGAGAYVVAVGYLDLHAEASTAGAVLAWDGTLTSIAPPAPPFWASVGVVLVTAVAFAVAWRSYAAASSRRAQVPLWTAALTLIVVSACLVATTQFPFSVIAEVSAFEGSESMPAVLAWARKGALSSAVYAFAAVLLVLSFLRPGRRTAALSEGATAETAGPSVPDPDQGSGM